MRMPEHLDHMIFFTGNRHSTPDEIFVVTSYCYCFETLLTLD